MNGSAVQGKRKTHLVLAISSLTVVALVAVWWFVDQASNLGVESNRSVRTDGAAYAAWKDRVTPALSDLNSAPALDGLEAEGPARIRPCSIDDGEVFGLSAGRWWQAKSRPTPSPDAATLGPSVRTGRGFVTLFNFLVGRDWQVIRSFNATNSLTPANPKYDSILLQRHSGSAIVRATLQVLPDGISVELSFPDTPAGCLIGGAQ